MNNMNNKLIEGTEKKIILYDINTYIDNNIQPSLIELKNKIIKSKINVAQNFLDEIKDYKSYTPLICSLFIGIPKQIALLLSLGLIGVKMILKWKNENIDIKNNGLYYLYDLKRRI